MIIPAKKVIDCVFYLSTDTSTGTCFSISYKGVKYLITAKHMFNNTRLAEFGILKKDGFVKGNSKIFYHENANVDVIVIENDFLQNVPAIPICMDQPGIGIGQEMYFIGFPFGIKAEQYNDHGFPFPFVKMANLSCAYTKQGYPLLWLDGINNPGFSGGPIIYSVIQDGEERQYLGGVISSYRCDVKPVCDKDGKNSDPELYYRENSGLIHVHGTKCIIDIIERNSI